MPRTDIAARSRNPPPRLRKLTFLIYGLHGLSLIIGLSTAATLIGAFVFGWPSLIAVVLNYFYRSEVAGTPLDSHFAWQIRTFWYGLLWLAVGVALSFLLVGFLVLALTGLWAIYRIVRGALVLGRDEPMPV